MSKLKRLLTLREVCDLFKITRRTLGRWREEGRFACRTVRVGRRRLFDEDDVKALIESHAEKLPVRKRGRRLHD